jgi:hypothetical protein
VHGLKGPIWFAAILDCVLLIGCSKPTVVGNWTLDYPLGPGGSNIPANVEFTKEGRMSLKMKMTVGLEEGEVVSEGKYDFDASSKEPTLSLTQESVTFKGRNVPSPLNGRTQVGKVKFDKDQFTWAIDVSGQTESMVFKKAANPF